MKTHVSEVLRKEENECQTKKDEVLEMTSRLQEMNRVLTNAEEESDIDLLKQCLERREMIVELNGSHLNEL